MQYKGDDLDLRVPLGRSARESYGGDYEAGGSNGRWARGHAFVAGGAEPLWVDEVLLACCNYAFDVAQANGAAEVGLEHLVNALTRVDQAARTLEARGVREGQLRRESAALIASEVPAANPREALTPRRSAELEDVLRRAAELAYRRSGAAGVDDVLWVLLHYPRDLAVVLLLRRLTPDWQRADWARPREPMREPPLPEPVPRGMPLVPSEGLQMRMATMEDSLRLLQSELIAERKMLMDLVRDVQRDIVAQRGDAASLRNDLGQRLDSIERLAHARGDGGRLPAQLIERIGQLERTVQGGLSDTARSWSGLAQRLAALETTVGDARASASGDVGERMTTLEKAVHSGLGEGARNWAALLQRLTALEAAVGERQVMPGGGEDFLRVEGTLVERMAEMGRLVEAGRGEAQRIRVDLGERLGAIESFMSSDPASGEIAVRELSQRLGGLERAVRSGFGEAATMTTQIADRLVVVERTLGEPRAAKEEEGFLIVDDRLGAIERMLEARDQQAGATAAKIGERLTALEAWTRTAPQAAAPRIDTAALMQPLEARLSSLSEVNGLRSEALSASLTEVNARLVALDERIRAEALVTEEALRGRDQDFDFIYNEIKQLGQSQTTLNSAVSDWRTEAQEHFGRLAARLDKLQAQTDAMLPTAPPRLPTAVVLPGPTRAAAAPAEPANDTTTVKAEDYELGPQPGRGFWYWLFGTGNVAQSRRETDLKVKRMQQNIKDARDRRRMQA